MTILKLHDVSRFSMTVRNLFSKRVQLSHIWKLRQEVTSLKGDMRSREHVSYRCGSVKTSKNGKDKFSIFCKHVSEAR